MKNVTKALAAVIACVAVLPSVRAADDASSQSAVMQSPQAASTPASRKAMKTADRQLAHAVRKSIEHDPGLDATRIMIVARGTVVTLTGTAPDERQIGVAGERAKAVHGVTAVVNRLCVGPVAP
jgi:hyperosmotically inducible periplasmic protein